MSTMLVSYEATIEVQIAVEPRRTVAPKAASWLLHKYVPLQRWAQVEFSTPGGSVATIAARGVGLTTPVESNVIHRAAVVNMLSKVTYALCCLLPYERRAVAVHYFQDVPRGEAAQMLSVHPRTLDRWRESITEKVSWLLEADVTRDEWRRFSRAADRALGEEPW